MYPPAAMPVQNIEDVGLFPDCASAEGPRMADALQVRAHKSRNDGRWSRQAAHPGNTDFVIRPLRGPGRCNTLLALSVLKACDDGAGLRAALQDAGAKKNRPGS
jgi:hypothetical protein